MSACTTPATLAAAVRAARARRLALVRIVDTARQGGTVAELVGIATAALEWSDADRFALAEELAR